jgi:hypothetical protein
MNNTFYALILCPVVFLAACESQPYKEVLSAEEQVKLRSFQTRAFDTSDNIQTMRTIIATLQDLGFVIDKADAVIGTVSATKLDGYSLRMTVTTRSRGKQILVRANAQLGLKAVEDPEPYQNFFTSLEKSMFLTAQQVD